MLQGAIKMSGLKIILKLIVALLLLLSNISTAQEVPSKTVSSLLRHSKLLSDDIEILKEDLIKSIVDEQYIVQLNSKIRNVPAAIAKIRRMAGGNVRHVYSNAFVGVSVFNITDFQMTQILNSNIVIRATRSLKVSTQGLNIQQNVDWGLDRLAPPLDSIYKYKYDGSGVSAYIVDTGIRISHKEFQGRASCGRSLLSPDCSDGYGHGTHVAGTIGGKTYGVAKNVSLIAVKVLDDDGWGSMDDVIAGIDYVIGQKRKMPKRPMVINLSLGGYFNRLLNLAINTATRVGIVCAVAAGNEASNACATSPASATSAITVGSTTVNDTRSDFSNHGMCVKILAPGSNIKSASSKSDFATEIMSGTSMATPHVAGVAALYLQKNPKMNNIGVLKAMQTDATRNTIVFPPLYEDPTGVFNPKKDLTPNLLLSASGLLK